MKGRPAKKILHIVEDLKVGGLEKILASIVLSLDKSKYDVQVWCLARGGHIAQALIGQGMSVRIFNLKSYYSPLQIVALASFMKEEQFHLIHTHGYFASTFGRLAAIWARIPVVVTHVHSTYHDYGKRNLLIERVLSYFTDRIICVSQVVQKFVIEIEGINEQKTCVVYNGADIPLIIENPEKIISGKRQWGIEQNDIVVVIVASLTENKGHKILLEAFKAVTQFLYGIKLLIVGDGPQNGVLKSMSIKLDIDENVIFVGEQDNIQEMLQISDLFVLSSLFREGLSIALIEAIAMGLPVITTNIGGNPEIIKDGVNGFLVPPGDADRLAHAIEILVSDPELRELMGRQGRKIYEQKFTLSRMIKQIETLYDQLLASKFNADRA